MRRVHAMDLFAKKNLIHEYSAFVIRWKNTSQMQINLIIFSATDLSLVFLW